MKAGTHLRRAAPAASAAEYADASRRGKGMKTGSAYIYFEFAPPDGRADVQITSRKLSDRPAGLHVRFASRRARAAETTTEPRSSGSHLGFTPIDGRLHVNTVLGACLDRPARLRVAKSRGAPRDAQKKNWLSSGPWRGRREV